MENISNLLVHIQRRSGYPLCGRFPLLVYVYRSYNFFAILTNILFVLRDAVDHVWMEIETHNNEMSELTMQLVDSVKKYFEN